MATTSLNPGVGPTNADIATAVAAPSSATIASAVAAAVPTISAINSAVTTYGNTYNGPSAATIASTTAASVPTLAQINTSVATNSPSPNNWTYLGSVAPSSATTFTISGLGGYRTLLIAGYWYSGVAGTQGMRINDATDTCGAFGVESRSGNSTTTVPRGLGVSTNNYRYTGPSSNAAGDHFVSIKIENCTNSSPKPITSTAFYNGGNNTFVASGYSQTAAAVSSVVFSGLASGFFFSGTVHAWGAN